MFGESRIGCLYKVSCLCTVILNYNVETPGDIDGIVYVNVDDNGYWKVALAKDMRAVGFNIDMNKVFLIVISVYC